MSRREARCAKAAEANNPPTVGLRFKLTFAHTEMLEITLIELGEGSNPGDTRVGAVLVTRPAKKRSARSSHFLQAEEFLPFQRYDAETDRMSNAPSRLAPKS